MSALIIDHALKSSVRIVRVIIARYREDCPRGEGPRISSGRPGRAWAPWGSKSVRFSVDEMFKCIAFNDSAAFWQSLCLSINLRVIFKYRHVFIQGTNLFAPASRDCKLDFQFLTYVRSSVCRMKTIGLISIQFTRNDQLRILYVSTKIYPNWMSASSSISYLDKRPLLLHA